MASYSAVIWLIGLCLLVVLLFLVASIKPMFGKITHKTASSVEQALPSTTQRLYNMLSPSLKDCTLEPKANRIIITKADVKKAIVTIDAQAVMSERWLDDVLIINLMPNFVADDVSTVLTKIRAHIDGEVVN